MILNCMALMQPILHIAFNDDATWPGHISYWKSQWSRSNVVANVTLLIVLYDSRSCALFRPLTHCGWSPRPCTTGMGQRVASNRLLFNPLGSTHLHVSLLLKHRMIEVFKLNGLPQKTTPRIFSRLSPWWQLIPAADRGLICFKNGMFLFCFRAEKEKSQMKGELDDLRGQVDHTSKSRVSQYPKHQQHSTR